MAILALDTYFTGEVGVFPRLVRMVCNDNLDKVLKAGYLNSSSLLLATPIYRTDFIFARYSSFFNTTQTDIFIPQIASNGIITLVSFFESGAINPPIILNGVGNIQLAGSVTLTNNSTTLVGSGTTFTDLFPGQALVMLNISYTIQSISSDTSLILTEPFLGPTQEDVPYFTDDNFLEFYTRDGNLVFEVGPAGQTTISGPLTVAEIVGDVTIEDNITINGTLSGGNYPTREVDGTTNPFIQLTDNNGQIILTNSSNGLLYIPSVREDNIPLGFHVLVVNQGTGTNQFIAHNTIDTLLYSGNWAQTLGVGAVARLQLIEITGTGSSQVGTWSIDIVGQSLITDNLGFSGPWSGPEIANMTYQLNNGVVSINMYSIQQPINGATSTANIQSGVPLPSILAPIQNINFPVRVNTGTGGSAWGLGFVDASGYVTICTSPNGTSSWAGSSGVTVVGFDSFNVSWNIT